jgi:methionyl-tRNA formyltransferase
VTLRIACFGLPLAACLLLRDGHDVRFAVLAPVAAPGRRRLEQRLGDARLLDAAELGASLEAKVEAALAREPIDLIVSWFWTRRLPEAWLARATHGGIGAHPSLLPRHRGPNPYFAAIDAGDRESGVTIHRLTGEYDDGALIAERRLPIGTRDAWQLARALDRPSLALLRETVAAYAAGGPPPAHPQDPTHATWAPEPSGDELRATWTWSTERVLRRIRALAPVPGLALDVEGLELSVTRAERAVEFPSALEPGEAAVFGSPPALVLRTGDGAIAVERGILETAADADQMLGREELAEVVGEHLARKGRGNLG